MTWSAAEYTRFESERTRPVEDLLARVPTRRVGAAADLGCGPGNSTEQLIRAFPAATVIGLDSSPAMIAAARKRLPSVQFELGHIGAWLRQTGRFDLILANAVLQWLPDHAALLPALLDKLNSGGCLAVQIPDNLAEPAHRLMREVAADPAWADKLAGAMAGREIRHAADWYWRVLRASGASVDVWRTTYYHVLDGAEAVVAWFKASGLRPFLAPLDEAQRTAFLQRYAAAIAVAYPAEAEGQVLLPFPRLFFIVQWPYPQMTKRRTPSP